MTDPTRLTDMEFDEVSLVGIPANQFADIVLFKSHTKPDQTTVTRRSRQGQIALARYAMVRKGLPDTEDVHEDDPEDKKKKGKKKKTKKDAESKDGEPMIETSPPA